MATVWDETRKRYTGDLAVTVHNRRGKHYGGTTGPHSTHSRVPTPFSVRSPFERSSCLRFSWQTKLQQFTNSSVPWQDSRPHPRTLTSSPSGRLLHLWKASSNPPGRCQMWFLLHQGAWRRNHVNAFHLLRQQWGCAKGTMQNQRWWTDFHASHSGCCGDGRCRKGRQRDCIWGQEPPCSQVHFGVGSFKHWQWFAVGSNVATGCQLQFGPFQRSPCVYGAEIVRWPSIHFEDKGLLFNWNIWQKGSRLLTRLTHALAQAWPIFIPSFVCLSLSQKRKIPGAFFFFFFFFFTEMALRILE